MDTLLYKSNFVLVLLWHCIVIATQNLRFWAFVKWRQLFPLLVLVARSVHEWTRSIHKWSRFLQSFNFAAPLIFLFKPGYSDFVPFYCREHRSETKMKMKTFAVFSLYILAACFMGCCISGIYICFLSSFEVPPRKTFESDIEIREDIFAIWGSNCTPKLPASSIFVDLKRELLAERDQDGKNQYHFLHARKTTKKVTTSKRTDK